MRDAAVHGGLSCSLGNIEIALNAAVPVRL